MLGLLRLDFAILHQIRPVPLVPLILLLIILLPVTFIFFVEQRQPLLGNITHSLEIDVDIGSVSLNIQSIKCTRKRHGQESPYLIGSHLDVTMEVPGVKPSSWQPIARELCV